MTNSPPRPLIVRLRNWVGDVVLSMPALEHLRDQGYRLHLIGKRWAPDLLAATGWPVEVLAGDAAGRRAQLRALRARCRAEDPGFDQRLNTVVFPFSLSSALEARLAGLKAIGYRHEGRSLLLKRALALPQGVHEIERYWQLAAACTGQSGLPVPTQLHLLLTAAARQEAQQRLDSAKVTGPYTVLCPFGGGPIEGRDKHWPGFPELARQLRAQGRTLVLCPGPDELELARRDYGSLHVLEGVGLSVYAALIAGAQAMVSNDTGPGHMAAAVGTPLVSVLGPTPPTQWRPWGPSVQVVTRWPDWPTLEAVVEAVAQLPARS